MEPASSRREKGGHSRPTGGWLENRGMEGQHGQTREMGPRKEAEDTTLSLGCNESIEEMRDEPI